MAARREAVLKPRVFGDFLGSMMEMRFRGIDIALNVLEDYGVPREKASEVLDRIDASARSVGFIEEIRGKSYVTLQGAAAGASAELPDVRELPTEEDDVEKTDARAPQVPQPPSPHRGAALTAAIADDQRRRRVFITHGKNRDLVDPIKKLLNMASLNR